MGDFHAATWNAEGITPISGVLAGVKQLLEQGATVLLLQEVSAAKCQALRDKLGLKVAKHPKASNAVAWLPDHWDHDRTEHVTLADPYLDKTRNKTIHTASPLVHLRHRKTGKEVGALSYHLPSRVQRKGPIDPERIRVRNQALATMDRLAGAMPGEPLFGGDDNVDERTGKWPDLPHLRQIAAPEGTLGGRRIDDFRVRDLVARGALVNTTKSQHDSYLRGFDFPAKVTPKPKPTPKPDTKPTDRMNPRSYFVGAKGDHVKWLAGRLVAHGYGRFYGNGVDRGFTRGEDLKAVAAFQRAQGWKGAGADGLPGPETLRRLAAAPKPKASAKAPGNTPALKLVTRSQWGARPRGATKRSHPIGSTKGVTLHWEGPKMGDFPHSACDDKVRSIERFHRDTRGWADIAYNAIVCPHGYVFEGRGIGVKSAANGSTRTNDDWYAVCYLGGQGDGFTDAGKAGFEAAVEWLRRNGAGRAVNGHRDHKATACPGDEIYRWLHNRY